ncbi:MAG: nucleoside phosphorylase [Flavobacteriales bacterium]|nr:nucleoside phosphorylase [Flavobacteriales bacterium]NNK80856.1 nucleoside phosphorylase [Flavobacteriales bacterium]
MSLESSELVLNPDGSLYHIALRPNQVNDDVIVVGDPGRVDLIATFLDSVSSGIQNREFYTRVGSYNGTRLTVMSTGIGTDNIDIAINELDAAVNIDLQKRVPKEFRRSLRIIRLGTSGALQEDIKVDTCVSSKYGLGLDGLMNYYQVEFTSSERSLRDAFIFDTTYPLNLAKPYVVESDVDLRLRIAPDLVQGITATASGFYAPQGRVLRIPLAHPGLNQSFTEFSWNNQQIVNYEMETSALYGLGRRLGHRTCTVCAVIANRLRKEYSKDYQATIRSMVAEVLERLTAH